MTDSRIYFAKEKKKKKEGKLLRSALERSSLEKKKMGKAMKADKRGDENPSALLDRVSLSHVSLEKKKIENNSKSKNFRNGDFLLKIKSLNRNFLCKSHLPLSTIRSAAPQQIWAKDSKTGMEVSFVGWHRGDGHNMNFRRVEEALWGFLPALIYAILGLRTAR